MGDSIGTQVQEAIKDTLLDNLNEFLVDTGQEFDTRHPPQFGFEPILVQGSQCPYLGIYEMGSTKGAFSPGDASTPGFAVWNYEYQVWIYVKHAKPEPAAQRAKLWVDSMRAVFEKYYTLGAVVTNAEVVSLQPTASASEAGGVIQAAGLDLDVVLGRAGQTVTIS